MTYHHLLTTCDRMGNTCPSKRNCHRHEMARSEDYQAAALNSRRDAGASACDCVIWIEPPKSTFVELQVAEAFGIDPQILE